MLRYNTIKKQYTVLKPISPFLLPVAHKEKRTHLHWNISEAIAHPGYK